MTPEVNHTSGLSLAEQMTADHAVGNRGREVLASSLTQYIDTARELNVLSGILVEQDAGRSGATLFNVYAEDFRREQNADPPFHRLSVLASQFSYKSAGIIDLDVRYLNPSRLQQEQERCNGKQIPITFIPFEPPLT